MLWKLIAVAVAAICMVSAGLAQPDVAGKQPRGDRAGKERLNAQQARAQAITITGTVKALEEIAPPEAVKRLAAEGAAERPAAKGGADRPAQREPIIGCTLTTEQGEVSISLAPQRQLDKLGLKLKEGDTITVTGMKNPRLENVLVAGAVEFDGKTYTLRQPKNPLADAKQAAVSGSVKDLVLGEGERGMARFVLVTDAGPVLVLLGPAEQLAKTGLVLENGKQVTVSGWLPEPRQTAAGREGKAAPEGRGGKQAQALIAREVTVDEKTYTLRDENGRPAGEAKQRGDRDARPQGDRERTRERKGKDGA
jgi:hypothetical protein